MNALEILSNSTRYADAIAERETLSNAALTRKLTGQLLAMGYDAKDARRIIREWRAV